MRKKEAATKGRFQGLSTQLAKSWGARPDLTRIPEGLGG